MTREEKLQKMKSLAKKQVGKPKWQAIAEWNESHKDALDDYVVIALRLINFMDQKGLQRKEVAERLGVSSQALGRILKGRQNLTLQTIRKIENVLGINLITVHHSTISSPQYKTQLVPVSIHYSASATTTFTAKALPTQDNETDKQNLSTLFVAS